MRLAPSIPVVLLAGAAPAQPVPAGQPNLLERAFRADQGLEDVGALGTSLRTVPTGLQTPAGFGELFRIPTVDGGSLFARRSGGVTAVFERSTYGRGFPLVPPGTVFVIGTPPPQIIEAMGVAPEAPPASAPGRIDRRISTRLSTTLGDGVIRSNFGAEVREPVSRTFGRMDRTIESLLRRAAEAEQSRTRR